MLSDINLIPQTVNLEDPEEKEKVRNFLSFNGLEYESDVDFTLVYLRGEDIVATGSLSHNIIKCVAISPLIRGSGILSKLMTRLVRKLYRKGYRHHFIFTKPRYVTRFKTYGFSEIVRAEPYVSLLEYGIETSIDKFVKKISMKKKPGKIISSMIVDCNPITQDHVLAINLAAHFSDWLHIFLISEPKFFFPIDIRLKLLTETVSHLDNVIIHLGGEYIVSHMTFPTYFLRKEEKSRAYALLGCTLYGEYIVPALNITHRYLRKEPGCEFDSVYNSTVKEIVPKYGVELQEVDNLLINGQYMSAPLLRKLVTHNDWKTIEVMVAPATFDFLRSGTEEAELVLARMRFGKDPYPKV